jgi:calcineurin-like phosphoesterase family protein
MKTFFTSDTHFGHAKAIEHGRPFSTIEEMAEVIVERWNKAVGPYDTVYHLGDFAMGKRDINVPFYGNRLNGKKWLICGNHDYLDYLHYHRKPEKAAEWLKVYEGVFGFRILDYIEDMEVCGVKVAVHHLPYVGDHEGTEPRFLDKRPVPGDEKALLHGHVHDTWLVRQEENLPVMINVGVDMWNFTPVSEEELEPWLK